jgi:hypothetical protein
MTFNSNRPCSSKSKEPNRYTTLEVKKLAKHYNIPLKNSNNKMKTMDELCTDLQHINELTPYYVTPPPIPKSVLSGPCLNKAKNAPLTGGEMRLLKILFIIMTDSLDADRFFNRLHKQAGSLINEDQLLVDEYLISCKYDYDLHVLNVVKNKKSLTTLGDWQKSIDRLYQPMFKALEAFEGLD